MMKRCLTVGLAVGAVFCAAANEARAWGGEGHYAVTLLALDAMEADLGDAGPAWLFTDSCRWRAAYQSREPDRMRSTNEDVLKHENVPEHFLDVEMMADFGLTLRTLPRLRYEFIGKVLEARTSGGEPWDPSEDSAMAYVWGGTAPYAVMEAYWRLRNDFQVIRLLEAQPGVAASPEMSALLEQARANAINHIGDLSHWIGDLAQPLHTSVHHHGWVEEREPNPGGYTTEYAFHGFIDSGVLDKHGLIYSTIREEVALEAAAINADDPWDDTLTHIEDSFAHLHQLYIFERDDGYDSEESKRFILDRLAHGGSTLAGFMAAAWRHSEPSHEEIESFDRYEPSVEALR